MGLVIVEHIDDGTITLHKQGCQHAERAMLTHPATPFWMASIDKMCGTCKPDPAQHESSSKGNLP